MTDVDTELPTLLVVDEAFMKRLPAQVVVDAITRHEKTAFGEIAQNQAFRLHAFRALIRDYPGRDLTSLWLHSYYCELQVIEEDPTNGSSPTAWPPSAATGAASPTT
jgi:hypothetical protein